jgi:hypothetical protein
LIGALSLLERYDVRGKPVYSLSFLRDLNLGYPPSSYSTGKIKERPKSEIYLHAIGLWFIPIIIGWIMLLILSIIRAKKMFAA